MIIATSTLILLLSIFSIYIFYKYRKLKTSIKSYEDIGTGRKGFYFYGSATSSYYGIIYVNEIDRYTDGYSKIKLDHIELISKRWSDSVQVMEKNFLSLKKTNEIDWLESEDHIKKLRKEKLENLKKI